MAVPVNEIHLIEGVEVRLAVESDGEKRWSFFWGPPETFLFCSFDDLDEANALVREWLIKDYDTHVCSDGCHRVDDD